MRLEQNIIAILETYFSGFKNELIEACAQRIMEQIVRQTNISQMKQIKTTDYCDICNHKGCDNCIVSDFDDYCVPSNYAPSSELNLSGYVISRPTVKKEDPSNE